MNTKVATLLLAVILSLGPSNYAHAQKANPRVHEAVKRFMKPTTTVEPLRFSLAASGRSKASDLECGVFINDLSVSTEPLRLATLHQPP